MKRKRIVVMGFMANCPIAGVIWQHLHYIVGLQRLGHEVYYVEDSARLPYNPVLHEILPDYGYATAKLAELAGHYGFEGRWAFCARYLPEQDCVGLSRAQVNDLYRTADAILNICGSQELHDDLLQSQRLIYVESDPGVEQIRVDKADPAPIDYLSKHHALFTFGESIGTDRFPVPLHQFRWLPTRQPIVTDFWKTEQPPSAGAVFTSIANWNTKDKDVEWRGDKFLWSKSLEFLRFMGAARAAAEPLELATVIHDAAIRERFLSHQWQLTDPDQISIQHDLYRDYIQGSKGEFTVAKDQYVRLQTGWFSDRSACYLAAGRPVITQQTGFTQNYGGHGGLFGFETLAEIAEAVREINTDYARHSRVAYEIAAEHFEATKVLSSLLERADIS